MSKSNGQSLLELYELDNIEFRAQGDWKWFHLHIPFFWWFMGLFGQDYSNFWASSGNTVYAPEEDYKDALENPHKYAKILRHERVHVLDMRNDGRIRYSARYATRKGRSYYERRGYAQNMIVEYERRGYVSDSTVDHIVKNFTGPKYLWMDPDARPKIEKLRDKIESREIQGLYPEVT